MEHPAPYPLAIPERLTKMFSFTEDTVLGSPGYETRLSWQRRR